VINNIFLICFPFSFQKKKKKKNKGPNLYSFFVWESRRPGKKVVKALEGAKSLEVE